MFACTRGPACDAFQYSSPRTVPVPAGLPGRLATLADAGPRGTLRCSPFEPPVSDRRGPAAEIVLENRGRFLYHKG